MNHWALRFKRMFIYCWKSQVECLPCKNQCEPLLDRGSLPRWFTKRLHPHRVRIECANEEALFCTAFSRKSCYSCQVFVRNASYLQNSWNAFGALASNANKIKFYPKTQVYVGWLQGAYIAKTWRVIPRFSAQVVSLKMEARTSFSPNKRKSHTHSSPPLATAVLSANTNLPSTYSLDLRENMAPAMHMTKENAHDATWSHDNYCDLVEEGTTFC